MKRPTRDWMLMEVAGIIATRSTCSRAHVGVVVAREGRILVTGYNGAPSGMAHCRHDIDDLKNDLQRSQINEGCRIAVHAEANAIAYAARWGIALSDAELFSTLSPCLSCSQLIINAGIERVIIQRRYRDIAGLDLLDKAGVEIEEK